MMWSAITYVSSGLTLLAFIIAVAAWVHRNNILGAERRIQLAPPQERAQLVERTLEFFNIDTTRLTTGQQYNLAIRQIDARAQRFRIIATVVSVLFAITAGVAAFAIAHDRSSAIPPSDNRRATIRQRVTVSATELWHRTNINVTSGEIVNFEAEGSWWNGISRTGPEGDNGLWGHFAKPSCNACPVPNGNLGQLVAKIGSSPPLAVGHRATHYVQQEGEIALAMNENLGACRAGIPGSCYQDNTGQLEVRITVWSATPNPHG